MMLRDDPVLEDLRRRWEEEDEKARFFDLTHVPGVHGGLSLIPLFVRARREEERPAFRRRE